MVFLNNFIKYEESIDFDGGNSERKKAYINAQKTLWEESGTMIPYHVSRLVVTSSKVKNLDEVEYFSIRWHTVSVD